MRWGRTLLILVISLVALIAIGLALAPSLVNLEQIKEQVVTRVEQRLKRDVELGQVRLEFFNGLGAGLDKLTIANPAGWESPHFVKVDALSIKVALWPLLRRHIEVRKVILKQGEIVVERDAQGRFNYDDLTATSPPASDAQAPSAKTPSGPSPLAGLLVSKLALQDVDIRFIDRMIAPGKSVATAMRRTYLEANHIGLGVPISFRLSSALLTEGDANVELGGRVGPIPAQGQIDWRQIPLQLALKVTTLPLAPVAPYLGASPPLTAGELGVDLTVQGALGDALGVKGQVELDKAVMPAANGQGQATTLPAVTLAQELTLNLATSLLTIANARADLGALQATVTGSVKQFNRPAPQLDLRLKTSTFVVDEVVKQWPMLAKALPPTLAAQGKIALQATAQGALERLRLTLQLDAQDLSIRPGDGAPLAFSKVAFSQDAKLDMAQTRLDLTQANLDVGFLQVAMQGTIANFDATPQLDLRLKTAKFDPAKVVSHLPMLAAALPQPAAVQGDLQLQATLQGTPDNFKTDASIAAPALSLKSGSFHGGAADKGGMRMDLAGMQTNLQSTYRQGAVPTANVDIKAKRLVFDQQPASAPTAPAAGGKPGGKPAAQPPVAAKAPPINARGNVALAEGSIAGMAFRNLKAAFSIINGVLRSRQTVQMFDGDYTGALTANLTQAKPSYQLDMKLANMQAGEVANTFISTPNILFGRLNTDVKLSGKGMDWSDVSTTLTGNGKIDVANFKLTTLDIMPKIAKGLSAVSALVGFTVPDDLATRSFDKLKASMRIQDGKVRSDDLSLWGPDVQVLGKGLFGLDQSLAFDGVALLLGKLAQSLGKRADFLKDKEGRINIPLAIRGSMMQPRVALDEKRLTDLAQRALTQRVQQQAGQEANKLLERVLPGAKTGDQPGKQADPVKEINKALQGLFKR